MRVCVCGGGVLMCVCVLLVVTRCGVVWRGVVWCGGVWVFALDDVGVDVCYVSVGSMVDGFRMTLLLSSGNGVRVLVMFARVAMRQLSGGILGRLHRRCVCGSILLHIPFVHQGGDVLLSQTEVEIK